MFLHKASALLQDHDYVHLISLDFSKAFDTVRHSTLVLKLADLPLPPYIHNWIVEWLNNRQHCTKFQGKLSSRLVINASIIQGSGIGLWLSSSMHRTFTPAMMGTYFRNMLMTCTY